MMHSTVGLITKTLGGLWVPFVMSDLFGFYYLSELFLQSCSSIKSWGTNFIEMPWYSTYGKKKTRSGFHLVWFGFKRCTQMHACINVYQLPYFCSCFSTVCWLKQQAVVWCQKWRIERRQIIIKGTSEYLSDWEEMVLFSLYGLTSPIKQQCFAFCSSLVLLCNLLAFKSERFKREITRWDPVINISCRKQVGQMSSKALCSAAYLIWHLVLAIQAEAVNCARCFIFISFPLLKGRSLSMCSMAQQFRSRNNSPWEGSGKFRGLQNSISYF